MKNSLLTTSLSDVKLSLVIKGGGNMKQENIFTAGYVFFLAYEAQKYAEMNENRTFSETIHFLDPETNQYALRVVQKTPSQKVLELKNDIYNKMSTVSNGDFEEIGTKIDEYADNIGIYDEYEAERINSVKEFIYQTFAECGFASLDNGAMGEY